MVGAFLLSRYMRENELVIEKSKEFLNKYSRFNYLAISDIIEMIDVYALFFLTRYI